MTTRVQQLFGFAQQAGLNTVRIWAFAPGACLQTAPGELCDGVCCMLASRTRRVWAHAPGMGLYAASGVLIGCVSIGFAAACLMAAQWVLCVWAVAPSMACRQLLVS